MRMKLLILMTVWAVVLSVGSVRAQPLTVYVGKVPPFTDVDHQGKVFGAAVDVVAEVMAEAGNPVDVGAMRSISWARAVEEVETKPGTMIFGMARTPQRENRFKWVGPIARLNLGLVGKRRPRIEINSPEDLRKYRLGVIRNSAPAHILEQQYGIKPWNMTMIKSDELQFRMLEANRVDLISQADTAAPFWLRLMGMAPEDYEMVYVLKELELYMAFNKATDDALLQKVQSAVDAMKRSPSGGGPSRYAVIMQRYMEDGPIPMQAAR